jgi:Heterokaryon incompatibility protein (HET)
LPALPKTIRDAVEVTRELGVPYLWVDSLCILQDDESDWIHESNHMGLIFENAVCTIAATWAGHAGEGLYRPDFSATDEAPQESDSRNFHEDVTLSKWNRRGWVVQERILSRRIIHFAYNQLYWECQQTVLCQSSSQPIDLTVELQSKPSVFSRMKKEINFFMRWMPPSTEEIRKKLISGKDPNRSS